MLFARAAGWEIRIYVQSDMETDICPYILRICLSRISLINNGIESYLWVVMEADIPVDGRGELPSLIEPMVVGSRHREALNDLALDLTHKSASFRASLPTSIVTSLADLVRVMNCYYSTLIEGRHTYPVDIERALKNEYSADPYKRDLQLEAEAHIKVQQWIDAGGLKGRLAVSSGGFQEIHRRFCQLLPEDLLWVEDPKPRSGSASYRVNGGKAM